MVFFGGGDVFGDTAAEEVGFGFGGEGGEGVVCRGLVFGGRRWEESFSIFREVLGAVWGIEAFGEDDEICAVFGRFEDLGACAGEVSGFIGAWWGLARVSVRAKGERSLWLIGRGRA